MLSDPLLEADERNAREESNARHSRVAGALALLGVACLATQALGRNRVTLLVAFRDWEPPHSVERCGWVVDRMVARQDPTATHEDLKTQYATQSKDANTFYRATAHLFWHDFVRGGWGHFDFSSDLGIATTLADGSPIVRTSAWTWVTGDQHLSNFGAWKNRNKDVVFGVNDFDEAVIYDFQMDVWRVAVSIFNHAITNGLGEAKAEASVLTFTDVYVQTLQEYLGNERADTREATPTRSSGALRAFLTETGAKQTNEKQLNKFTEIDEVTGERRFIKSAETKLETVAPEMEAEIRRAFSEDCYGSTLMKIGWHAKQWDDKYFRVLDVGARIGAGVGSFGVGRYYVLLAGRDADGVMSDAADDHGILLPSSPVTSRHLPPSPGISLCACRCDVGHRRRPRHHPRRQVRAVAGSQGCAGRRRQRMVPYALPKRGAARGACPARPNLVHGPLRGLGGAQRRAPRRARALAVEGQLRPREPAHVRGVCRLRLSDCNRHRHLAHARHRRKDARAGEPARCGLPAGRQPVPLMTGCSTPV